MGLFDRPNKFIIETAIDVGIDNVKKSQNLSPEALKSEYDKAKKALEGGNESEEIQALYKKFIEMYDRSISDASRGSQKLSEEIQWKHLGDLKEAVKNGGKGLSSSDIEGLNRYALVEYARQERMDIGHRNDEIQVTLKEMVSDISDDSARGYEKYGNQDLRKHGKKLFYERRDFHLILNLLMNHEIIKKGK